MATRILLADDHEVVRAGIRKAIEEIPGLVVTAEVGSGVALMEALEKNPPDCLLIDVAMPQFDPLNAIHQIRTCYPDIKILVVSAYDDDVYVKGLLGAGVNGYHLKDQPLGDLKLALQKVLSGERWISGRLIEQLLNRPVSQPELPLLTLRQREILDYLWQGLSNRMIANKIGVSVKTIENHLTRLYRHLNVQSRLEAVNFLRAHPGLLGRSGRDTLVRPASGITADPPVSVLVVDDNVRYRGQLLRMIGRICPQAMLYEAQNILNATRLVQSVSPRLVLVDVVLGEEDGIQCTRRIKAIAPGSRVVLISAYPDREFHRLGLEAGASAFLDKKNLDLATLRQVVNDLFN